MARHFKTIMMGSKEIANLLFEDICKELANDSPGAELKMPDLFNNDKYIVFGNKVHDSINYLVGQGLIICEYSSDGLAFWGELTTKGKLKWEEINRARQHTETLKLAPRKLYVINEDVGWIIGGFKHSRGQTISLTEDEYLHYTSQGVKLLDFEKLQHEIYKELDKHEYVEQKLGYLANTSSRYHLTLNHEKGDNSFKKWIEELTDRYNNFVNSSTTINENNKIMLKDDFQFYDTFSFDIIKITNHFESISDISLKRNYLEWLKIQAEKKMEEVNKMFSTKEQRKEEPYTESLFIHTTILGFIDDKLALHTKSDNNRTSSEKMQNNKKTSNTIAKNRIMWKGSVSDIKELFNLLEEKGLIQKVATPNAVIRDCFVKPNGTDFDIDNVKKSNTSGKSRNYQKLKETVQQIDDKKGK